MKDESFDRERGTKKALSLLMKGYIERRCNGDDNASRRWIANAYRPGSTSSFRSAESPDEKERQPEHTVNSSAL